MTMGPKGRDTLVTKLEQLKDKRNDKTNLGLLDLIRLAAQQILCESREPIFEIARRKRGKRWEKDERAVLQELDDIWAQYKSFAHPNLTTP